MKVIFLRLLSLLLLATLALGVAAQEDDIADGFKKLDAAEVQRLRAVLAEPVPTPENGKKSAKLKQHFRDKEVAARLLGDEAQFEAALRESVRLLADATRKDKLADLLIGKGQFIEGNELRRQALAAADPFDAIRITARVGCDRKDQNQTDAARATFAKVASQVKLLELKAKSDSEKNLLWRASTLSDICLADLELRLGRYPQAIAAAESAELNARKALVYAQVHSARRLNSMRDVAKSIRANLSAYVAAGRLQNGEAALNEWMRYSREVQLHAKNFSDVYVAAGHLRFSQREFLQSEQQFRKSDSVLAGLGREPDHSSRTSGVRNIVNALAGQKKWNQALIELERLDQLAGDDAKLKKQVLYRFERAVVYLGNQRYTDAAPLFEEHATSNRKLFGDSHFFTAQATGLQGASLWRSGTPESKAKAVPLLKAAVRDYMAPANADFLENIGYRKERREEVFAAYLEALSITPGEDATQAIGAADWVHTSIVQESLSDAAVRAAASTPALADVVRREQDAKNEVTGIRRYLSGEAGGASSPLPQIAAQMRERIAVLEADRVKLQAQIKAKFPDYDRLVRPAPPTVQQVASKLETQQALLMLLPTTDAVYVWAVAADRLPAFVRANLTEQQVNALVTRLRSQLDFGANAQAGKQFDSTAAFELYDKLLAPMSAVWTGKTQLIVAAGGRLSQLPFGVLQTQAGAGFKANAPWLIKQASIAQVPSLSAWLAIKSIANAKPATQAFIGWGDPAFKQNSTPAPVQQAQAATRNEANTSLRSVNLTRASTLLDLEALEKTSKVPSALNYADIPPLPETRDELLAIAQELGANPSTDLLLGERASRQSVLSANQSGSLGNKRVLAFATHGLMAGDLPNLTQPALALAASNTDAQNPLAPLLTLEDVLTLKLNADWVVLSACNTAAADGKAEEALSGLARGFFYAGSRSLLVTHWAVESESAKQLTTSTFAHYAANPQAPKAESLRQAMLKVMAQPAYSHPAYWAPYALVGDGGR